MRVTLAYPYDGHDAGTTVTVDESTGRRLIRDGRARVAGPGGVDLDELTLSELQSHADALGIHTSGVRRKADLREAIRAAQSSQATRTTILPTNEGK